MRYIDIIRSFLWRLKGLIGKKSTGLQPREILLKLTSELENKKKLGIEENAFVPNVYAVYLSPVDYEELSPLLSGIKEQLKNKLMERIKKNGYRLLSTSISIELREDLALEKNQVVVESSFLKEKTVPVLAREDKNETTPPFPPLVREKFEAGAMSGEKENKSEPGITQMIEDKKTKIIDNTKIKLEIIEGENRGEVIALKEGDYTFGRGKDAQILIKDRDETVSRLHFKLIVREGRINIKDLNSSNGTRVNDIDIEEAELKKGDTINAGKVLLKVA